MKKIMITLAIGMLSTVAFPQNYHKLIRTNTYWDCYLQDPIFCYFHINRIYFTGADTVLDGNTYSQSKEYPFAPRTYPGPLCPPFVIDTPSYSTNIFIREDTVLRKVFIYDDQYTPHDQLLYDFSLQVGDTLHSQYNGAGTLYVTSIENVTLNNGEVRQKFVFNNMSGLENYIESIGGSQGLFDPILMLVGGAGGYFCMSENEINLWGTDCNNYFVGITHHDPVGFLSISPNPVIDNIKIETTSGLSSGRLELYNDKGEEVLTLPVKRSKMAFNVSSLTDGVYFVRLTSVAGVATGRFIKIRGR